MSTTGGMIQCSVVIVDESWAIKFYNAALSSEWEREHNKQLLKRHNIYERRGWNFFFLRNLAMFREMDLNWRTEREMLNEEKIELMISETYAALLFF